MTSNISVGNLSSNISRSLTDINTDKKAVKGKSEDNHVILEVFYQRINPEGLIIPITMGLFAAALTESPIGGVALATLALMFGHQGAIGHTRLLTPNKTIGAGCGFTRMSFPPGRSKSYDAKEEREESNPRIKVYLQATQSQIQKLEESDQLRAVTCAQGASNALAEAGLPHVPFPFSLLPTISTIYYENILKKDSSVEVKHLNWSKNKPRIEPKIGNVIEITVLALFAITIFCALTSTIGKFTQG